MELPLMVLTPNYKTQISETHQSDQGEMHLSKWAEKHILNESTGECNKSMIDAWNQTLQLTCYIEDPWEDTLRSLPLR